MSDAIPNGAQPAAAPHPGKITFRYEWNHSTEIEDASRYPDSFRFRCFDADGRRAARDVAVWCIPVVETVTTSVDQHGRPAVPKEADFIGISVYGPSHTFLEHIASPPGLKRQRELDRQRKLNQPVQPSLENGGSTVEPPSTPTTPTSQAQPDCDNAVINSIVLQQRGSNWWARVKTWLGLA